MQVFLNRMLEDRLEDRQRYICIACGPYDLATWRCASWDSQLRHLETVTVKGAVTDSNYPRMSHIHDGKDETGKTEKWQGSSPAEPFEQAGWQRVPSAGTPSRSADIPRRAFTEIWIQKSRWPAARPPTVAGTRKHCAARKYSVVILAGSKSPTSIRSNGDSDRA